MFSTFLTLIVFVGFSFRSWNLEMVGRCVILSLLHISPVKIKVATLTVSFQCNAVTCGCVNFEFANESFWSPAAQVIIFPVCSWGVLLSNNRTLSIPWRLVILPVWVGQRLSSDPLPVFSFPVSCFQADEPLVVCWIGKVLNFFLNELPFSFGFQGNELSSIFSALFLTISPGSDVSAVEVVQYIILNSYFGEKWLTKIAFHTPNLKMWREEQKPTDGFNAEGFFRFSHEITLQL